jgi:uncharacterized membrane protein YeaQ/YmgE (transglycosylase-associated protein family)
LIGLELTPSLAMTAVVGLIAVAVYGLLFVPPLGRLGHLLIGGQIGAVVGQAAAEVSPIASPALGGLHVLESFLGAWLLVWIVRRLVV